MGTTADKLNYLLATKDEIKAAITAKGVNVSSSTFRECAQKIREIPQEVNVVEPTITAGNATVRFRDYDGMILHSFSKDEFLDLTELPPLPTREGLICQGWNYTLAAAQSYVTDYGKLEVGAMYITDDGKTRLYISVLKGRQDVPLNISQTIANGVTIDWGDGSATETISGSGYPNVNTKHHYNEIGDYCITLDVANGCTLGLGNGASTHSVLGNASIIAHAYRNMLKRVEIGKAVTSIGDYAFYDCHSLASIVIPQEVTSIGRNTFYNCFSLVTVEIPQGVTSIGSYAFYNCYGMAFIDFRACTSIPSLSENVFKYIAGDCKFIVPDTLYDEWIAATNWSEYASYIIKASEFESL